MQPLAVLALSRCNTRSAWVLRRGTVEAFFGGFSGWIGFLVTMATVLVSLWIWDDNLGSMGWMSSDVVRYKTIHGDIHNGEIGRSSYLRRWGGQSSYDSWVSWVYLKINCSRIGWFIILFPIIEWPLGLQQIPHRQTQISDPGCIPSWPPRYITTISPLPWNYNDWMSVSDYNPLVMFGKHVCSNIF